MDLNIDLRQSLQCMRKNDEMCDVCILSKEGTKYPAHKLILAASSPVFKVMVTKDFKELQSKEIHLRDIEDSLMTTILDFMYTGELSMTNENALDLFMLADRMELANLFTSCTRYIKDHIDANNCLGVQRIAERYNQLKLNDFAESYLLRHFQVFASTEDFLDLTSSELIKILWRDELNVEKEEYLIDFILKWVDHDLENRNGELEKLMKGLRFPLMNFDFIEGKFRTHPRWKTNKKMAKLVKTIYKGCFQIFHRINFDPYPSLKCLRYQYRLPSQVIFLYGGWNRGRTLDTTECFNIKTGYWSPASHLKDETEGRSYFGIDQLNGEVYMAGGYNGRSYLNTIRKFNPSTKEWASITPMHYRRCFTSALAYNSNLYVLAGFDGVRRLTSVEKYCPKNKQWTVISPLNVPRSDAAAVVHRGRMYIFGGYAGDALNSGEIYDAERDNWTHITNMNVKRSGASAVSFPEENKIMVIGGYNGTSRVATVGIYDPVTNRWTIGPPMSQERSNFATCVIENKLYVMGGYTGSTTLRDVEIFDLKDNTWQFGRPIGAGRSAMKAICLDIAKADEFFEGGLDPVPWMNNNGAAEGGARNEGSLYEINTLEGLAASSSDSNESQ